MSFLKNQQSYIYRKGLKVLPVIMIFSAILTQLLDNTSAEKIFRGIWIAAGFLAVLLFGVREVFLRGNKIGYLYFLIDVIFVVFIFSIYLR